MPWLHLAPTLGLGYLGYRVAHILDDTAATVERQWSMRASLPSWAAEQLTPEEAAGEARLAKLDALREKFAQLAEIEEAEYRAQLGGVRRALAAAAPGERGAVLSGFSAAVQAEHQALSKLE